MGFFLVKRVRTLCAVAVAVGPSGGGSGDRGLLSAFPPRLRKLRPGWDSGKEWLMEAESCVLLVGGQAMGTGVAGASAGRVLVLPRPGLGRWALVSACNFFLLSLRKKRHLRPH